MWRHVLAVVGILWGTLVLLSAFNGGPAPRGNPAYTGGYGVGRYVALAMAVVMIAAGLNFLLRGRRTGRRG